jgi:hypothetical protein
MPPPALTPNRAGVDLGPLAIEPHEAGFVAEGSPVRASASRKIRALRKAWPSQALAERAGFESDGRATHSRVIIDTSEPPSEKAARETTRDDGASRSPVNEPRSVASEQAKPTTVEPTDGELEAAIVRAVTAGAFDVAKVLASQLEQRRRARLPANVVALPTKARSE